MLSTNNLNFILGKTNKKKKHTLTVLNIFQEIRKRCITLNWIIERGGFSFKMGGATITLKHVPIWTGKAILFFFQLYKITISILPWKSYFKKKREKTEKNREYSDVIQFLRWGKSITLTIGGRVHVASESSKHSLIFFLLRCTSVEIKRYPDNWWTISPRNYNGDGGMSKVGCGGMKEGPSFCFTQNAKQKCTNIRFLFF